MRGEERRRKRPGSTVRNRWNPDVHGQRSEDPQGHGEQEEEDQKEKEKAQEQGCSGWSPDVHGQKREDPGSTERRRRRSPVLHAQGRA